MSTTLESRIAISFTNGNRLEYFSDKDKLINECIGTKDLEFGCEFFKIGSVLKLYDNEYIIVYHQLEFESILSDILFPSTNIDSNSN